MVLYRSWRLFGLALGLWLFTGSNVCAAEPVRVRVFADADLTEATIRSPSSPLTLYAQKTERRLAVLPAATSLTVTFDDDKATGGSSTQEVVTRARL